jgi:branched-subunit amino acid aminotransferase/4-amino-4-deoxychorismate lyase
MSVKSPFSDRLAAAACLIETMMAAGGDIRQAELHWQRLRSSAAALGIPFADQQLAALREETENMVGMAGLQAQRCAYSCSRMVRSWRRLSRWHR